jgi:hypothetical protein
MNQVLNELLVKTNDLRFNLNHMKYKSDKLKIQNISDKSSICDLNDDDTYFYFGDTMILKYENKKLIKL